MATLVVTTGRAIISGLVTAITALVPKYMGWGTGAGTTAATDTDLFTTATEARVAGTPSQATTTTTNDTIKMVATMTAAGAKTITNIGFFDAAGTGSPPTGGNLWLKGDFTGIALSTNDSITATATDQLS